MWILERWGSRVICGDERKRRKEKKNNQGDVYNELFLFLCNPINRRKKKRLNIDQTLFYELRAIQTNVILEW